MTTDTQPTHVATPSVAGSAPREPSPLTYQHLARNIANISTEGAQLRVLWKDARTTALAGESVAAMVPDASIGGRMRATMKRSIVQEIAASIMRAISSALGGSAGRVVRDVAYSASYDLQSRALASVAYSEESRRDAVVRAFAAVRHHFVWDGALGAFVVRSGQAS